MYIAPTDSRYLERVIRVIAGVMILLGLAIWYWFSPWGLVLPLLVGVSMLLFGLFGICPMAMMLRTCGLKSRLSDKK